MAPFFFNTVGKVLVNFNGGALSIIEELPAQASNRRSAPCHSARFFDA